MSDEARPTVTLHCNFCGKDNKSVEILIAGPTAFICNECVDLCFEVISIRRAEKAAKNPPPQETL